jgi:hypothetical protein
VTTLSLVRDDAVWQDRHAVLPATSHAVDLRLPCVARGATAVWRGAGNGESADQIGPVHEPLLAGAMTNRLPDDAS